LVSIGQAALVFGSMRGTAQAVAAAWYGNNVYALFLAPIALAALYYLLPKRLGRPIAGYSLAKLGFWSFAVFASFGGLATLAGSPVPAWVQTLGLSSNFMLLIPLLVIGCNLIGTLRGGTPAGGSGPALSFLKFGAVGFVVSGLLTVLFSVPAFGSGTALTYVGEGLQQLRWQGFATMALIGAIYFLLPRLTVRPWPSGALITAHYWASVSGVLIVVVSLVLAGFAQGGAINDPEAYPAFAAISGQYSGYLVATVLGYLTLLVGHLAFLVNVVVAIYQTCFSRAETDAATLFPQPPALEVNS
jgi:cytochrome c oxidase cbb3-type subunit 1